MLFVTLFDSNTNCNYLSQFMKGLQRNLNVSLGVGGAKGIPDDFSKCLDLAPFPLFWY